MTLEIILAASMVYSGGDIIELRPSSEGHVAEVYYKNSPDQNSRGGVYRLELDGVEVSVQVIVSGDETLIVHPYDPTMIAVPDWIDVPDGMEVVVQIMLPMF